MTDPTFPARRPRALVLGAAILVLHWLALRWLAAQTATVHPRMFEPDRIIVLAQLPAPELKKTVAPAPRPRRHGLPPPRRVPPPAPAAAQPPPVPEPEGMPLADAAEPGAPAGDAVGTGPAGMPNAAPVEQVASAEPAPAPAAPPAPAVRTYKVDMPPSADLTLDVARTDADGTKWSGEQKLSWKIEGERYRISAEAGIRVVFARVNLLVLASEGTVTDSGFAPVTMTEKRRGRALTATHFNREAGTITFSASQKSYPLEAGAQDKASVPLQLAAIARADPGQLAAGVDMLVGEDRDASVFHFVLVGQEQIETRLGRMATWHLSRPPKPGSYNSRLDIWLSPERGWYPVQIRNLEASGAVTTQTVNNIVMTDTGS
jgi:hypothetical protein